jgi:hypothetical protein
MSPYGQMPLGQPGFQQGFIQPGYPPQGFVQPGLYRFSSQLIDTQARISFMRYDFDRSGTLDLGELQMALNEFCIASGSPPLSQPQFFGLVRMFDFDGSGSLDFFEYKMLLEQLGGIRTYDSVYIRNFRRQRNNRLGQYMAYW